MEEQIEKLKSEKAQIQALLREMGPTFNPSKDREFLEALAKAVPGWKPHVDALLSELSPPTQQTAPESKTEV